MCIVGAGFTGLWTAHSLALADPTLRVAVVEARGGRLRRVGAQRRLVLGAVRHVRRRAGPPARTRGHARHAPGHAGDRRRRRRQRARARASTATSPRAARSTWCAARRSGCGRGPRWTRRARSAFGEDDLRWLGPEETRPADRGGRRPGRDLHAALRGAPARAPGPRAGRRGRAARRRRSSSTPRCPTSGRVRRTSGPSVETRGGTVQADVVVRATEAWTPTLPGLHRDIVPVYSLMVATEPLGEDFWAAAGLEGRATFADHRHMIIYGQRTADGRIAFGGRGAPYHYGSTRRDRLRQRAGGARAAAADAGRAVPRPGGGAASPTPGAARSASRATGTPRSASTAARAWPGPGATSATGWPRPTWPVARWPT